MERYEGVTSATAGDSVLCYGKDGDPNWEPPRKSVIQEHVWSKLGFGVQVEIKKLDFEVDDIEDRGSY